jgi:hypothetical protein
MGTRRILSWLASIYRYYLQSTSNLLGNVWADLPATVMEANGLNLGHGALRPASLATITAY